MSGDVRQVDARQVDAQEVDAQEVDVLIAGGGMVGATLALALSLAGCTVSIVERRLPGVGQQPSFDDRCTALSNGSQRILSGLGLWSDIDAAATAIRAIHVSERGRLGVTRIRAEEEGVSALGHVIVNRQLGEILWGRLQTAPGVEVLAPAEVVAVSQPHADAREIMVRSEQGDLRYRARLLVAADGAGSSVRSFLNIGARVYDYGQTAIVANVAPGRAHEHWAWERFTPQGPMALLPMSEERCALIWTAAPEPARALMATSDEDFLAAFQQAFGHRLGVLTRLGKRNAYPLALSRAQELTAPRAVLLGNAANSLHPVAGQGFNLGLRDVAALAELLADAQEAARQAGATQAFDPGADSLLTRYRDWRRPDHAKVVAFTDGLVRMFAPQGFAAGFLRSVGLLGFDLLPGAKATLARHSMGLAGELPRLMRGVPLR